MASQNITWRIVLGLLGLMLLFPASLFGLFWYWGYWVHRDCIKEAWRMGYNGCFVPEEVVNYSGNAVALIWPALFFLALAVICFLFALKRRATEDIVKSL